MVAAVALSFAVAGTASAAAPAVGSFQKRASSPHPVNNVTADPTTNMIYAQQFDGKGFYRYNPRTNTWTTLHQAPISQGNNGGAAYVKGKIYTVYTNNDTQMGVYDIATGTWSTITNPLGMGTGDITSHMGLLYLVDGTDFISYDPATATTSTLATPPFSFSEWAGLAAYKGDIFGQQGDDSTHGFAKYDIATNSWISLPDLPGLALLGAAITRHRHLLRLRQLWGRPLLPLQQRAGQLVVHPTVPPAPPRRWWHGVRVGQGPAGHLRHLRTEQQRVHPLCHADPPE